MHSAKKGTYSNDRISEGIQVEKEKKKGTIDELVRAFSPLPRVE